MRCTLRFFLHIGFSMVYVVQHQHDEVNMKKITRSRRERRNMSIHTRARTILTRTIIAGIINTVCTLIGIRNNLYISAQRGTRYHARTLMRTTVYTRYLASNSGMCTRLHHTRYLVPVDTFRNDVRGIYILLREVYLSLIHI